jgi:hypothetical protein
VSKDSSVDFVALKSVVQDLDPEELLGPLRTERPFLFIDLSHVHKPGSDVEYYHQHIYPFLPPSTLVHVHDMCTPYPRPLFYYTRRRLFWNEEDFLEAFLAFNPLYQIELSSFWMWNISAPVVAALKEALPVDWLPGGSSLYLRRTSVTAESTRPEKDPQGEGEPPKV